MFKTVIVAGTFDSLHRGHEAVLKRAFGEGERVTIGLTSDAYVAKFKVKSLPAGKAGEKFKVKTFQSRKQHLENWLKSQGYFDRARIVPLDDPIGPAVTADFEALIVTSQNRERGEEINRRRKARGLPEVTLIEVPLIAAADGAPISATRVRDGEIDRHGRLVMPEALRPELIKPLGRVLTGAAITNSLAQHRDKVLIAVGDVATKTLLEAGFKPKLAIIDGRVGRQPYHELNGYLTNLEMEKVKVVSGPGYISGEARRIIQKILETRVSLKVQPCKVIEVAGEEDLLTLPAVVYAPLGAMVYYGQPEMAAWACGPLTKSGLVEVEVTPAKKREVESLLMQFEKRG
ncbi:MAG: pantetheine-phosphate adenylyltransferase [Patescibacteria group bacterium]